MCFACRQLICFIQFTVNAPLARLREIVRANQRPIICRRAARQSIARLIRLRSRLHPPPGSGDFASRILRAEHFHGENMKDKSAVILLVNLL